MTADRDRQILADYLSGGTGASREVCSWIDRAVRSQVWGDSLPADEIAQEIRCKVYSELSRGAFEGRSSLKCYVWRIAANICMTWIRHKYRTPPVVNIDKVPDPPDLGDDPLEALVRVESEDLKTRVVGALMSLVPPECRDAWRMVYFERLSYEEIASRLNIEVGTVKSRMSRCKQKARSALRAVAKSLDVDITEYLEP